MQLELDSWEFIEKKLKEGYKLRNFSAGWWLFWDQPYKGHSYGPLDDVLVETWQRQKKLILFEHTHSLELVLA